jgi:hypothetical protein
MACRLKASARTSTARQRPVTILTRISAAKSRCGITIARQRFGNTLICVYEQMRDSQLLDNGSVNTFPWQRIGVVSNELFEVFINIQFASYLQ